MSAMERVTRAAVRRLGAPVTRGGVSSSGPCDRRGCGRCHGGVVLLGNRALRHVTTGSIAENGAVLSPKAAAKLLNEGFEAQTSGCHIEALSAYRQVQRGKSPILTALASNAEGLLFLRAPLDMLNGGSEGSTAVVGRFGDDGARTAEGSSLMPQPEFYVPGDEILAPWAEDGGEYAAVVVSVDVEGGRCQVAWDDGDQTHLVVPLAGVSTMRGGVCAHALKNRPAEVRAWLVRRAFHQALHAWGKQAELGHAHDSFVDLAGLLCDVAAAEVRAALISPDRMWRDHGFDHARRYLQRARWMSERAYAPDTRALAILCIHRAELLRITCAAETQTRVGVARGGSVYASHGCSDRRHEYRSRQSALKARKGALAEVLSLHETAAAHLAASSWRVPPQKAGLQSAGRRWPVGGLAQEVVQEILWAKAFASVASLTLPPRRWRHRKSPVSPGGGGCAKVSHGRSCGASRRSVEISAEKGPRTTWSLPEKLMPPMPSLPRDSFLGDTCPARNACARAWRALCDVAGDAAPSNVPVAAGVFQVGFAEASCVAAAVGLSASKVGVHDAGLRARLLLEAAVVIFAMGCRLRRTTWALAVATPLAQAAAERLREGEGGFGPTAVVDDAPVAANLVADILVGEDFKPMTHGDLSAVLRASVLARGTATAHAGVQSSGKPKAAASADEIVDTTTVVASRRLRRSSDRWRFLGYLATEELWVLRRGYGQRLFLPAAAPFTWCPEGVLLSETAPLPSED
eukprot:TRINITY_DN55062_c0_g1_i1.p1 TRINITY_DN55062_c0_g1~~TRINITY_DN55062_c0_g1_i1.p1  ORF type:complete len:756 (+),score=105.73 TRINITY_DN55062_c0_g1_i1:32-2269(+)